MRYWGCFRKERTLFTTLATVNPRTIAMTPIRISRANDTEEVDSSTVCRILRVENATTCLTPTSEISILNCRLKEVARQGKFAE